LAVVAIDFGTTFSGYAYSLCEEYRKDQSKIYILTWQSGDGLQTYKTPTTILFDKDGTFCSFGYKAEHDYARMCEDTCRIQIFQFSFLPGIANNRNKRRIIDKIVGLG
jgi:hypothetical protein